MTDTNNKEETFENKLNNICLTPIKITTLDGMDGTPDEKCYMILESEINELKQLHDKEIRNEIIKSLEAQKYLDYIKNSEIKELQVEVEKLKEELLLRRDEGLSFED